MALSAAQRPVWRGQLERLATWVAHLGGFRRALAASFAGAVAVLAFAPVHAWPVMFVSFGLLLWLLDGCYLRNTGLKQRLRCAGLTGFWFGFGYFLLGLYWVAEAFLVEPWRHAWLLPFAMTLLPGGMALFYVAAALLAMLLWSPGAGRVFALAAAFGIAELARGYVLTGLPWNLIGYALAATPAMMQTASLFGGYALSLVAVLFFASPAAIWGLNGYDSARRKGPVALALALLMLFLIGLAWGERRLAAAQPGMTDVRLRIVQANVDQASKWRPENSAEIFADYLNLTRVGTGAGGLDEIDLVVWPETAVPFLLADSSEALLAIGDLLPEGTTLLVGSARIDERRSARGELISRRIHNSLLSIDDKAQIVGSYDKIHLVPFGEYLPFQDFMESIGIMQLTGVRGGFSAGKGPRLLSVPDAPPASPLICYEIIFPQDVTDSERRPGWLLNLTNDAWFGRSAGPYQHFHQAQLRAVEQGLPVVRAANTGISAIIDPYGRVLAKLGLQEEGVVDGGLPQALDPTPFVRWGNLIEIVSIAFALCCCFAFRVQPKRALGG